jgi:hypothetical protein
VTRLFVATGQPGRQVGDASGAAVRPIPSLGRDDAAKTNPDVALAHGWVDPDTAPAGRSDSPQQETPPAGPIIVRRNRHGAAFIGAGVLLVLAVIGVVHGRRVARGEPLPHSSVAADGVTTLNSPSSPLSAQ